MRKKIGSNEEEKNPIVSEIWEEMQKMEPERVRLDQVYLDPNNPRLEVLKREPTPDERVTELGVQQGCLEHLKELGVKDLMGSIRTSGFCTIDRIVLKSLDKNNYIVVEGNRRVAALKIQDEEHKKGRITIPDDILKGIQEFEALVYKGERSDIAWIVQGFRHAPEAIKEWKDYSKAKFFAELENTGRTATEIAKIFNVRPKADVGDLIRSYYGYQQAKSDEDYGEQLIPSKHFGFFSEVIFKGKGLKEEWLGWNSTKREFRKPENLNKFLSWIVDNKITITPETRGYLPKLLLRPDYEAILARFEEEKGVTIRECIKWMELKEPKPVPSPDIPEIIDNLKRMKDQIDMLPLRPIKILGKTSEEKEQKDQILTLLNELVDALNDQIKMLRAE